MYAIGDEDPTVRTPEMEQDAVCSAWCQPYGLCTWEPGHEGQHVAGTGEKVVGVADPGDVVLSFPNLGS